jgi:hypothetical protein
MLVKELIAELQKCNMNQEVIISGSYTSRHVDLFAEIDRVQHDNRLAYIQLITKDLDFPSNLDGN